MLETMLDEAQWEILLGRIQSGECTLFVAPGACAGVLPLGSDVADKWAKEQNYPLDDCRDLARVAQFLAIRTDAMHPKEKMARLIREAPPPNFNEKDEPHSLLADLPFSIYITTNYDDFMVQALKYRRKDPKLEVCRWNKYIKHQPSISGSDFIPAPQTPIVFQVYGNIGVLESLVLTEDDYLDFLISISHSPELIPSRIQSALAGNSILLLGYQPTSWNFRIFPRYVLKHQMASIQTHNWIQLPPMSNGSSVAEKDRVRLYLDKYFQRLSPDEEYFRNLSTQVYWGTCHDFIADLRRRC
jgi:hypothetical protein